MASVTGPAEDLWAPTRAQRRALDHGQAAADRAREEARAQLAARLAQAGEEASFLDRICEGLRAARGNLHFHPDRLLSDGRSVVEHLLVEGRYRSQFETGISNGSLTAFRGGQRDQWEESLFGKAYREASPAERPKYGALNLLAHADGASPRFGSCYFVLHPRLLDACTFTWGDSHAGPDRIGTIETFEPVLAALFEATARTGVALGRAGMTIPSLIAQLAWAASPLSPAQPAGAEVARGVMVRSLDDYVEMQIHADIELSSAIEAIVVDPAFEGTPTGDHLRALAALHGFPCRTHEGFVLAPGDFPASFRGPEVVDFAARVEERFARVRGEIDVLALGRAAAALHHDPASWRDWAPPEATLQHIKQLWHALVAHGRPRAAPR